MKLDHVTRNDDGRLALVFIDDSGCTIVIILSKEDEATIELVIKS